MKKIRKTLAVILSFVLLTAIVPVVRGGNNTKAEAGFAITAPTDNALVAAGYFDIKWSAANGTVTEYEVYLDDKLQGTTNSTVYECYTTGVYVHSAYIVAKMSDGSRQTSDTIHFGISKKGLGLGTDMGANISLKDMGCSWYYNWGTGPSSGTQYNGIEFVPMQWGNTSYDTINNRMTDWAKKGYKYALAFNEPDLQGQGVTSVDDAVDRWPAFMNHGMKVGSPASFLWPSISSWLKDFMVRIDNNVDFVTIHCYPENNPGGKGMADWFLKDVVDSAWELYHKPIWITEFSTADTTANKTAVKAEKTAEFWKYVMEGLDAREYVERYAAFCFNTSGNPGTGLWNYSTGELSLGGEVYRDNGNPAGYVPEPEVEPDYKTTVSTRTELLSDDVVIDNITYTDCVNKPGVTAVASTKNGNNSDADKAIDEDIKSRWESKHGEDPQFLTIDLGQVKNIKQIGIVWETASAKTYTIDVSIDGISWTTVALVEDGKSTQNRFDCTTLKNMAQGRYVRINGIERTTGYGYSIYDVAIYGTDVEPPAEETTTEELTTEESATKPTITISNDVSVVGFQISSISGGFRTVSTVEPEINGKKVIEFGNIYGIVRDGFNVEDMYVGSKNVNVAYYKATEAGIIDTKFSDSDTAINYVRTMTNNGVTSEAYLQKYKIRAYAKLADGTYLYSIVYDYSIYQVADAVYQNSMMPNYTAHNYIYNNILKVVDSAYKEVEYEWNSAIIKPQ